MTGAAAGAQQAALPLALHVLVAEELDLAERVVGLPRDAGRVGVPVLVRLRVAAVHALLGRGGEIGLLGLRAQRLEFVVGVDLQAEVIDAGAAAVAALRDREVDARVLDHPLGVVGLADGRLGAEQRRVEADAGVQVLDADVHVEAFHALTFREVVRVEDEGAHAAGPQAAPPSAAQQFWVRNASSRFIDAKSAE